VTRPIRRTRTRHHRVSEIQVRHALPKCTLVATNGPFLVSGIGPSPAFVWADCPVD
jgi:hypothetical protein